MFVLTLLVVFTSKSSLLATALNVLAQWNNPFYYPAMGLAPWQSQYFYNYALQSNAYNPVYQPALGLAPWQYQPPFPNYGVQSMAYYPFRRMGDTEDPILGDWEVKSVGGKPVKTSQPNEWTITDVDTDDDELKKVPGAVKGYKFEGYYLRRMSGLIAKTTTGWKAGYLAMISNSAAPPPEENPISFVNLLKNLNGVKVENEELVISSANDVKIVFARKP